MTGTEFRILCTLAGLQTDHQIADVCRVEEQTARRYCNGNSGGEVDRVPKVAVIRVLDYMKNKVC